MSSSERPWVPVGYIETPVDVRVLGRESNICKSETTTMSTSAFAGDDPRDAEGEVKLSLPETWPVESMGKCDVLLGELGRVCN